MKNQLTTLHSYGSHIVELKYVRPFINEMRTISCAEDANSILRDFINPYQIDLRECFWVILLTNANRVLAISEVATGTSRGVQTNPKYIFQLALIANASALIIAHNHPSGTLKTSTSDVQETKKIKQIAALMEITLLDHLIITSEGFVSLNQENKM